MEINFSERIVSDPRVMVGKAIVRGTRIPVEVILKMMAQEIPEEEILEEYPRLEHADILAVLDYAAHVVARDEIVPIQVLA